MTKQKELDRTEEYLQEQSTEALLKLAAFERLTWQSVHVHNIDAPADEPRIIDVMAKSTLADVRLVLSLVVSMHIKWSKARPLEFLFVSSQEAGSIVTQSDERTTPMSSILHHGYIIYVQYSISPQKPLKTKSKGRKAAIPTFTAQAQIGVYSATANFFVDHDSVRLTVVDIIEAQSKCIMKNLNLANDSLSVELSRKMLAELSDMTAEMVVVMLTNSRQQHKVLNRVLNRLQLNLDTATNELSISFSSEVTSFNSLVKMSAPRRVPKPKDDTPLFNTADETQPPELSSSDSHTTLKLPFLQESSSVGEILPQSTTVPSLDPSQQLLDNSSRSSTANRLQTAGSTVSSLFEEPCTSEPPPPRHTSISAAPLQEFDREFIAVLGFITKENATPLMSYIARDELLLNHGMSENCIMSKASKSLVQLREAFQRIMLHHLLASLQSSASTNAVKQYLWKGLQFCLWREVRDDALSCCRFDTMTRFNVIQSKLRNHDVFPGYKEPRDSYPESVVTAIRCLRLVLEPSEISWVDKKGDNWHHIVALGLNAPKEFRATLKKLGLYCRTKVLPVYHRQLLGRWTCTFGPVDPSEDSTFAVSILRRLVHVIVDATDANWNPSIKLTDCFSSAVATKESTGLSLYMTELRELLPGLLNLEGATKVIDEGRCAEIDAWCTVMVSQSPPWPPLTRWYIPRLHLAKREERYMFLAERDIAFEMYCAFEVKAPLRTVFAATGESMMTEESLVKFLCMAFELWYNDQDVKHESAVDFKSLRVGFGINMNHVHYLSKLQSWYLKDAFKHMNIEKLGIGSGISFNGMFCCVMLRLYGSSWKQPVEVPHKMSSNFLSFVNEASSDGLQSVLHHGGLHICKLLFAKEKMGTLLTPLDTTMPMESSGLAAMVYERCLMEWINYTPSSQVPFVLPACAEQFPIVMHLIHLNQVSWHFVVHVLKGLNELLVDERKNVYVAGLLMQTNCYSLGSDQKSFDMMERLVDLMEHGEVPIRVAELAQKAVLSVLLHPILASAERMIKFFHRLPDQTLGFKTRLPLEITMPTTTASYFVQRGCLEHLMGAINLCFNEPERATATTMESLQTRYLCLLASIAGIAVMIKNARAIVTLIKRCLCNSSSSLVNVQCARVLLAFMLQLCDSSSRNVMPQEDRVAIMESILSCLLCECHVSGEVQLEVGTMLLSGIASLVATPSWNQAILQHLYPLVIEVTASQRVFWLDRVIGTVSSATPSPKALLFSSMVLNQHQKTPRCTCRPKANPTSIKLIVVKTASIFVANIFKRSFTKPQRAIDAEVLGIMQANAAKRIQQRLLRWMYVKRKSNGFLPVVLKYTSCATCHHTPSLLASLILLVCDPTATSSLRLVAFQTLTKLWYSTPLVGAACEDLKVAFVYLVLSLHEAPEWRQEALYGLSYLTWYYPAVLTFVSITILKSFWSVSYFMDIGGTWIDHVIHKSLEGNRKVVASDALACAEVDATLHFLVLLSCDVRVANYLTRSFGFVMRLLQMCNDMPKDSDDSTLCRLKERIAPMALLMMQNVLVHLGPNDDFRFNLPYTEFTAALSLPNPTTIKIYVLSVIWALALREEGRQDLQPHGELLTAMIRLVEPLEAIDDWNMTALVHNCFGALASVAVDKVMAKYLRSHDILANLGDHACHGAVVVRTNGRDKDAGKHTKFFYTSMEHMALRPDVPIRATKAVQWKQKLRSFGVLPLLGTGDFNPFALHQLVRLQVVRCYNSLLIHETRDGLAAWLGLFPIEATHALVSMTSTLVILARLNHTIGEVIPESVLHKLTQLISLQNNPKLQLIAIKALGALSVLSPTVKQWIWQLDIVSNLSHLAISQQLEVVNMLAMSMKNTEKALPPSVNEEELVHVLYDIISHRDKHKVWHEDTTLAWSPIVLDNRDFLSNSIIFETNLTKYLRHPLELMELCQDTNLPTQFPQIFLSLLEEIMLHINPNTNDSMLRDGYAVSVQISQTLIKWSTSQLQDECISPSSIQRLVRVFVHSLSVEIPTLTSNVVTMLHLALDSNKHLLPLLLEERGFVSALLTILSEPEKRKAPTVLGTLHLLGNLLSSDEYRGAVLGLIAEYDGSVPGTGFFVILDMIVQWPDKQPSFIAVSLKVVAFTLEAANYCTMLLSRVFRSAESVYKRYLLQVWSSFPLTTVSYSARNTSLKIAIAAAHILKAISSSSGNFSSQLIQMLLSNDNKYSTREVPLEAAVKSYNACCEGGFGWSSAPDDQETFRVNITKAMAHLSCYEEIRHAFAMQQFIVATTKSPLEDETNAQIQANIMNTYENVMCVPSIFRQLVYGSGVFLPVDMIDKPLLHFVGRHLALENGFQWVYANVIAKCCLQSTFEVENRFLSQHVVLDECLTDESSTQLIENRKDLMRRIERIEAGMHFNPDLVLPRIIGARLVHELFTTILSIFASGLQESDRIITFMLNVLTLLHEQSGSKELLIQLMQLKVCVDAIQSVQDTTLPALLELISKLFRVSPLYKQAFLNLKLTNALVHRLATATEAPLVTVLNFLYELARNDGKVACVLVEENVLLRQVFGVLQLPIVFTPTFHCLALHRPNASQLDAIIAATKVLCAITTSPGAAIIVFDSLEVTPTSKGNSNDRTILRTILDLLAVTQSQQLRHPLLALTQHFARANPVDTVTRLCDHGGVLMLFECVFDSHSGTQELALDILRLLIAASSGEKPTTPPTVPEKSPQKLEKTASERYSMAIPMTFDSKRRVALRPHDRPKHLTDAPSRNEPVALILSRITFFGAVYPIYDHRLDDMTLGNQTTEVDFVWIEDMLRRLVVFGRLSFAELHVVSRALVVHRVLPSRLIISEPGLYIITTGKVEWHLENATYGTHFLEKGCLVGISTCLSDKCVNKERATSLSAVVSLFLSQSYIDTELPSQIQEKLYSSMRSVAGMFTTTKAPIPHSYLDKFKHQIMQPARIDFSAKLLANVLNALAQTKETLKVNVWLLVHLINDVMNWHDKVPIELTQSLVHFTMSLLQAQENPQVHCIVLKLGENYGARGAKFFALTWHKRLDQLPLMSDVVVANQLATVLGILCQYKCLHPLKCKLSKRLCKCTLTARRVVLENFDLNFLDLVLSLCENQFVTPRLDLDAIYSLLSKLFKTNRYRLASYLRHIEPKAMLSSFLADIVNLAEDDSPNATKLLGKLCRHPFFHNALVELPEVHQSTSVWLHAQIDIVKSGFDFAALQVLEMLSLLCCTNNPSMQSHLGLVFNHLLHENVFQLLTMSLQQTSGDKAQLVAIRALRNLCVATKLLNLPHSFNKFLDRHQDLLHKVFALFGEVASPIPRPSSSQHDDMYNPFVHHYGTKLIVVAEVVEYCCSRHLNPSVDYFSVISSCLMHFKNFLSVPVLSCFLQNAADRIANVFRSALLSANFLVDQYHAIAYGLLDALTLAHTNEHEGVLSILVHLVSHLSKSEWFRTLSPAPGTVNLLQTFVAVIMEVASLEWDSVKHASALCALSLCQSPICMQEITREVYIAKICSHLHCGFIGMHGFVGLLALLCKSKELRPRLLPIVPALINVLPFMVEHHCLAAAANVLWALWKTVRKASGAWKTLSFNDDTMGSLLVLLQPKVPWFESSPALRVEAGAGAISELLHISHPPAWQLAGIVQSCSSHLKVIDPTTSALVYHLVKTLTWVLHHHKRLYTHFRYKREMSLGAILVMSKSMKRDGPLRVCLFATCILRLEQSPELRLKVQDELTSQAGVWRPLVSSLLKSTISSEVIGGLELLRVLCHNHQRNTGEALELIILYGPLIENYSNEEADESLRILEAICSIISTSYRLCSAQARNYAALVDKALNLVFQAVRHWQTNSTLWCRLVIAACRACSRLLDATPCLDTTIQIVNVLVLLPLGQPRLLSATYTLCYNVLNRKSNQDVPHDIQRATVSCLVESLINCTQTIVRTASWRLLARLAKLQWSQSPISPLVFTKILCLGFPNTEMELKDIILWLRFAESPQAVVNHAQTSILRNCDDTLRSLWLVVLHQACSKYQKSNEFLIKNTTALRTLALSTNSLVRARCLEYISDMLMNTLDPMESQFVHSLGANILEAFRTTLNQLTYWDRDCTSYALFVLRLVDIPEAFVLYSHHFVPLYTLLVTHLNSALKKNHLDDAALILHLVFRLLSGLPMLKSTAEISDAINMALLKQTSLPLVLYALQITAHFADNEIYKFSSFMSLQHSRLSSILLSHAISHVNNAATQLQVARCFFSTMAHILSPKLSPSWFQEELVAVKLHIKLLDLSFELASWPELMADCLLVLAHLFACCRTARDLTMVSNIIVIATNNTSVVAIAALDCLYQLYRRADSVDFDAVLILLDHHVPTKATFGLLAYLFKCTKAKALDETLRRVVEKHLAHLNANQRDSLEQGKFLYGLVCHHQQLLDTNALAVLFKCISKPCSKTSAYALESLVIATTKDPSIASTASSIKDVILCLGQHLLYGMANVPPHLHGTDSLRKSQRALQLVCVEKSLEFLHTILDNIKPQRYRQMGQLFGILLTLTQFGPDALQVSAMNAALKYFNVFRCEWFIFDGTDRVLECVLHCLMDPRLQALSIQLLLAMSPSKRLQLSILEHPTAITSIFSLLKSPIEFTGELWCIVANLASAGEYARPLSDALLDARQWLIFSKLTISEQQSIAMTLARLSDSPKLSVGLTSFQDWLMVFEREAQVETFLLEFQEHLMVQGHFSEDNQKFELLVAYLGTVGPAKYKPFKPLELMLNKVFHEFVQLIVTFYLVNEEVPCDIKLKIHEKPRLRLCLPKWLGCNGVPYSTNYVYKQILTLFKSLCHHDNLAIATSCWESILNGFQEMTQKSSSGCYLFIDEMMIELIDLQLPACTIEHCKSLFISFHACARIRLLSATFCNGNRSPWSVFCATALRVLHLKNVTEAMEPFLLASALLSENKIFLQAASLKGYGAAVFSMLLYFLHHSLTTPMAYSTLAAQIFVRLCTVSTIALLQKAFLSSVEELGRLGITKHSVAQAMIYAIYLTNFECEMHLKVLVRLIHSVLLRMVAIGRIDKGIPTLLHDNGLESLFLCTKAFMGEFEHQISTGTKVDWAMLSHWVQALREEHTKYCLEGYEALYAAFMSSNHNPQLNVAISSTKHAVMCYQTLHYILHQISDGILHIASSKGQAKEVLALGLHEFFHRLECIGEWVILCLQNPDVDVGYYTNQIEALCTCVNGLLSVHGQTKLSSIDKVDQKYPIRISLEKLHLRSWMWALVGTKPYVRLSIGAKHAYFGCTPGKLTCRCKHKCGKYVHLDNGVLYVTSAEALQSMDIQVWMYLPWWPIDICIGRASASFPMATGTVPIEFYPEQRDKMRFDIMQPYGELHLLVSVVDKELPSSNTFPFSTCGSKSLRQTIDRWFMSFVSKVKALWLRLNAKSTRVVAVTGRTNRQFGSSNHGSTHCVEAQLSELQSILLRCTEKDKLIGSYEKQQAFTECKAIMDKLLDTNPGSFNSIVPLLVEYLTDASTHPIWDRVWTSVQQTIKLYMPLGLSYLKSHLHVHNEPSVAHFHYHRAKYNEVSCGISGINYSAQQLKPASILRGLRPRFMKLPSIKPEGFHGHSDVAAIVQVINRHHRTQWQQVVMPHMSLFTLSEARSPSWCELDQMVPPDTMNHFFIQPLERLQVLIAVARFSTLCFGHSQLARLSIQYTPVTVQATRASLSHLADRLKAWLIDQVPVAPPLTLVAPALNPRTASRSTTTHLLKHMATMKRSQAHIMGAQSTRNLERRRKHHLATFGDLDPFDGYSKLQALNARASNMPSFVYKEGFVADVLHIIAWVIIITTVWRLSMTLETLRDAAQTYNTILAKPSANLKSLSTLSPRKRRARMHTVDAGSLPEPELQDKVSTNVLRTEKELRYFLVIAELKGVVMDLIYIWPSENGKIGLGDFWSSLYYTALAFGLPFFFYYFISPMTSDSNQLAIVSCWYGIFWVVLAFLSIVSVTRNIPGFNQTRRVDSINLTEFPSCLKNYLAILNILWELVQLNTIPWQVWDASYAVHKIASLVTIDWEVYGYQVYLQFNVFEIKQRFACVCLIMWLITLKAANKFKSMNWLNYFITFLLPSTLSSILFMFLSEQYIYSIACFRVITPTNTTMYVLWSNNAIECWTPLHWRYAIFGMFGMSLFIPLAVLSYGSHQLAFPQLDLDIQTSPLFAMVGQLVKGLMIGAKTFFVTDIRFYLAISIAGDVVLFAAHYRFPKACSTWHVRAAKLLIYTLSLWSAICAMITTFVDHATIPLSIMYSGHAILFLVFGGILRYRVEWLKH